MSLEAGTIYVPVRPDLTSFGSSMTTQSRSVLGSLGGTMSKMSKALIAIPIAGAVVAGIGAAVGAVSSWTQQAEAAAVQARELRVRLAEMGHVAGVSAAELLEQNDQLSLMSAIDDDLITKGTTLLATFGNIRNEVGENNDIFTQANALMVDYAAQFTDGNMVSAATQLGKALDNPIKGMSALARVGVSFNDVQTEQITKLVEANDLLGAQKVILKALKPQVDGAAKAAASGTEKLSNAWAQFTEFLGTKLLPVVRPIFKGLRRFIGDITKDTNNLGEVMTKAWERHILPAWEKAKPQLLAIWNEILDVLEAAWNSFLQRLLQSLASFILQSKAGMEQATGSGGLIDPTANYGQGPSGNSGSQSGRGGGIGGPGRVIIEDRTERGVTATQSHSARMARSNR